MSLSYGEQRRLEIARALIETERGRVTALRRGLDQQHPSGLPPHFVLDETQIPKAWYNLAADLQQPLPPVLHPGTRQPVGPADLEPLFPMELILQEV